MTIDAYIKKLTLEEKAALLQGWTTWSTRGIPRLQIPEIFLSDGPHGLRKQKGAADHLGLNESIPATCFPTAAAMANTWDPELGQAVGEALGTEAAACDVHVLLGPGLNMKRSPLCGRNFEYFSEDPYLAGKMAAAYIRGIQSRGVAACPKHFAVNSQELRRQIVDEVLDERTLREIYLTGFEIAVTEGSAKSIMSSYNRVNGIYANENAHLLMDILRKEWGFDGFVVTDWGADNDHIQGVRCGSNLVMPAPGPNAAADLVDAVDEGRIPESALDDRLREMLPVFFAAAQAVSSAPKTFDAEAHHALARKCAEESIVLLDNDGILPLRTDARVAVIGDFAQTPRYQGAGSSVVNPTKVESFLDCCEAAGVSVAGFARGYERNSQNVNDSLIREAVALAEEVQTVLLCIGLDEMTESEGMDRSHMELTPGQNALIDAVCAANSNVILVISGGAPFVMPPRNMYRAAIHGYLGGQAGAGAMVDAIFGKVNPSGKLNETWPHALEDNPSYNYYPGAQRTAEHREGLYIGYRYYDTAGVNVRYPFGHGLSYTKFAYSNLHADSKGVAFTLTNTGNRDGAEVVQLYVACRNGQVFRPRKELKGFTKVYLKAGESRTVTIPLDDKAFRYFNVKTDRWEVETANYDISIAASAGDVKLTSAIRVFGTDAPNPYGELPSYRSGKITQVPDEEFETLLGRPIPASSFATELLDRNDSVGQLGNAGSAAGRMIYRIVNGQKEKGEAAGKPDLNILFVYNMPFRAISKMAGNLFTDEMVDDLVYMVNGHTFKGLGRLIRDFFHGQKRGRMFMKYLEEGPTDIR